MVNSLKKCQIDWHVHIKIYLFVFKTNGHWHTCILWVKSPSCHQNNSVKWRKLSLHDREISGQFHLQSGHHVLTNAAMTQLSGCGRTFDRWSLALPKAQHLSDMKHTQAQKLSHLLPQKKSLCFWCNAKNEHSRKVYRTWLPPRNYITLRDCHFVHKLTKKVLNEFQWKFLSSKTQHIKK